MRKLRSICLVLMCLWCLFSTAQNTVTLMSYNIKGGAINSVKAADVAKIINHSQPDVVSVQEVHLRPYALFHDYLKELAEATGMYYQFLPTVSNFYGIGLLSRTEPLSVETKIIPFSDASKDKENRGMIIAEFPDYYFISTHYSLNADDRDRATDAILRFTDEAHKTVFVAGDFNAQPTYRAMVTFKNYGYVILNDTKTYTFPSDKPTQCIDMILSFSAFEEAIKYRVTASGIAETPNVNLANTSDHLPVYVKLRSIPATGIEKNESHKISIVSQGDGMKVTGIDCASVLSIYTPQGQLVKQTEIEADGLIDFPPFLSKGVYIIRIQNSKINHSIKLMYNN